MAFQWLKFAFSLTRKVEHIFMSKCHLYFLYLDCIHPRRKWQPTPVLLPGESHGWRSLVGCSPWGGSESDTTELLHFHFHELEKEMATHSSVLAWRIPRTGRPGGLLSTGSHRVRHDWSDLAAADCIQVLPPFWDLSFSHWFIRAFYLQEIRLWSVTLVTNSLNTLNSLVTWILRSCVAFQTLDLGKDIAILYEN